MSHVKLLLLQDIPFLRRSFWQIYIKESSAKVFFAKVVKLFYDSLLEGIVAVALKKVPDSKRRLVRTNLLRN